MEPVPPAVEAQCLNHWTAREVPREEATFNGVVRRSFTEKVAFENRDLNESGMKKAVGEIRKGQQQVQRS